MDSKLKAVWELEMPAVAMQTAADSLPGFGIVAAVLGIVITMGDIGGDAETIGLRSYRAVGTALVYSVVMVYLHPLPVA